MDEIVLPAGGHVLTPEEELKLKRQHGFDLKPALQAKFEKDAARNWNKFYERNETRFYKDRHWILREFPMLETARCLLEVGCGVGNTVFPLSEEIPGAFIHCCDFAPKGIALVKANPLYDPTRMNAFVCDITDPVTLLAHIPDDNRPEYITSFFVLSAIHPDKMADAFRNLYRALRPGGRLLFRDYGLYDHAQLRFPLANRLGPNFYVRQDGTRCYYFSTEILTTLLQEAGFEIELLHYHHSETVNHLEKLCVERVFVHAMAKRKLSE